MDKQNQEMYKLISLFVNILYGTAAGVVHATEGSVPFKGDGC